MAVACVRRRLVRTASVVAGLLLVAGAAPGDGGASESPLLPFSTYLGGEWDEGGRAVALGPDGVVWIAGTTSSQGFPGAPLEFPAGALVDADLFVVRMDPTAHAVLSTVRLGGWGDESVVALAVDSAGNAYLAGHSDSFNFPATGRYGPGSNRRGSFVARLRPDGSGFSWVNTFGYDELDEIRSMCLTANGDPVVVGATSSDDLPLAAPIVATRQGDTNAFVARLRADGTGLVFSTYLGGASYRGNAVCATPDGTILVSGESSWGASFLPTAEPILRPVTDETGSEGFLLAIDPPGARIVRAARLGKTFFDKMVTDTSGRLVAFGYTGDDLPIAAPRPATDSNYDDFLLRIDGATWAPIDGTYLGSLGSRTPVALAVAPDGTIWTARTLGDPLSQEIPVILEVPGAIQPLRGTGYYAGYIAAFEPTGLRQVFGTLLSGDAGDLAEAIVVADDGSAWVTGLTSSSDFPVANAVQSASAGRADAFVAQIFAGDPNGRPASVVLPMAGAVDGHSMRVQWTAGDDRATTFAVYRSDDRQPTGRHGWKRVAVVPGDVTEWVDTPVAPDRNYVYAVQATNAAGGSDVAPEIEVRTPPTLRVSIRRGNARYSWARPRRVAHPGDLLRFRGRIRRALVPPLAPDPRRDGLTIVTDDYGETVLFRIPPGDAGWTARRRGGLHWRGESSWLDFDPRTGTFDVRIIYASYGFYEGIFYLVSPSYGPTTFRFVVGDDAGSVTPAWRYQGDNGARTR